MMKNIKQKIEEEGEKLAESIMSAEPFQRIYGSARELIKTALITVFVAGGEYVENLYKINTKRNETKS